MLKETEQDLIEKSNTIFEKSKLLGKEAFFSDVSLEQISKLDEKGNEIDTIAEEATVRFLYKLNGIMVDGGGAKSYAFFNPAEKENGLIGIYHAWREITDSIKIRTRTIKEVVESALKNYEEYRTTLEFKEIGRDLILIGSGASYSVAKAIQQLFNPPNQKFSVYPYTPFEYILKIKDLLYYQKFF